MELTGSADSPFDILIQNYDYELPEERIARYPLPERDASKLLVYRKGDICHCTFRDLAEVLPPRAVLLFNDSRVIHARLRFSTPAGKSVEIFCLEPSSPADYQLNFSCTDSVRWHCLIGGNRHWKQGPLNLQVATPQGKLTLLAERLQRVDDSFEVQLSWQPSHLCFGEVLHLAGVIPLPPYLNRDAEPDDEARYQTIYARPEGSVAAPTAGLHFTARVFDALEAHGLERVFVTLHVGAGTFVPVKSERIGEHAMHEERIIVSQNALQQILDATTQGRPIIPVGTTAMRVLESLYWQGVQASTEEAPLLDVGQWTPYQYAGELTAREALQRLAQQMEVANAQTLEGHTRLMIAPGYRFRLASGLITNFHQPKSTLMLLVAAWAGTDWRRIYQYALDHDFRFLSYGDSSLLL